MERWKPGREVESEEVESDEKESQKKKPDKNQSTEVESEERNYRWNATFSHWFVGREGRKVGSLKWRARRHVVKGDMPNCTPLRREAHVQVKMQKTHQVRTTFWSYDVEKWHATVVRRAFTSQKVRKFPGSAHFWKLGCRKIAHRSSAKHIFKQKKWKHEGLGPLFEAWMSKNGTPLWREAHNTKVL